MLTAYVLNELDDQQRRVVDDYLKLHPECNSEVESIRSMADRVEVEFARSQDAIPIRAGAVRNSDPLSGALVADSEISQEAKTVDGYSSHRRGRFAAFLLTGLAASLAGGTLWMVRPVKQDLIEHASSSATENRFGRAQADSKGAVVMDEIASEMPAPSIKQETQADQADAVKLSLKKNASAGPVVSSPVNETSEMEAVKESISDGEGLNRRLSEAGKSLSEAEYGLLPGSGPDGLSSVKSGLSSAAGGASAASGGAENMSGATGRIPRFAEEPQSQSDYVRRLELNRNRGVEAKKLEETELEGFALSREKKKLADRLHEFEVPDELRANVPSLRGQGLRELESSRSYFKEGGDRFDKVVENGFVETKSEPLSTFSIDVDTASYTKLRQYVLEQNVVPQPESIRIEEWLNYFDYQYAGPKGDEPFAAHLRMAKCPWNARHQLVRVAIQAKRVESQERPASNLVFLIDVSGSMADANKLPLVKRTLTLLANQLREQDRVAIVVYAGAAGCVLPSTTGDQRDRILAAIDELQSGGSTNGGKGIELAYRLAKENFIEGGVNRVILCTDGDFNVGVTSNDALVELVREQAKGNVFMTCLGYGSGNYNDSMMERITNEGNGIYGMVDSELEARRVMGKQLNGNLMTVAKDVKIQVEFNPRKVQSYRLLGYENRRLAAADFNNDRKDAGEIGAGHCVTALYEVVPAGQEGSVPGSVDELRYAGGPGGKGQVKSDELQGTDASVQKKDGEVSSAIAKEWCLLKVRSKRPEGSESTKQEFVLEDTGEGEVAVSQEESRDLNWALSVAEFGLLMRRSGLAPEMDWDRMLVRAYEASGEDPLRRECVNIMRRAKSLVGR
jgi:Ca-activated chloride channel family protein